MTPKKNRAKVKDLEEVFNNSRVLASQNLSFRYLKDKKIKDFKISFIVPKTVSKSAVKRNLLRRRGYAVLENKTNPPPPPVVGAFVFGKKSLEYFGKKSRNKKENNISIKNLENEIKNILSKLN